MDYATLQSILGWAAVAAALVAGGIVGVMLAYDLGKPLWSRLARLWRRSPVECVAAVALLCYCVAWGGGKITFPRTNAEYELLKDAGTAITTAGTTNVFHETPWYDGDSVDAYFTLHPIVPDKTEVQMWRRPVASTNDADWEYVKSVEAMAYPLFNYIGTTTPAYTATNWNWVVFTSWQPAPAVQTNGVLHVDWWGATNGAANAETCAIHAVPFKSAVETDKGFQLAPTRTDK